MIRFTCPTCKGILQAPEQNVGVVVACPKCKTQMRVPGAPRPAGPTAAPPPPQRPPAAPNPAMRPGPPPTGAVPRPAAPPPPAPPPAAARPAPPPAARPPAAPAAFQAPPPRPVPTAPPNVGVQARPSPPRPPVEDLPEIVLEQEPPKDWKERLARFGKASWRETRAVTGATWGQTARLTGYAAGLGRRVLLKNSAAQAHRTLGHRMAEVGTGDPNILRQIAALDEQITQGRADKKPVGALEFDRRKLVQQLADGAVARTVPPPGVADDHQKVVASRQALEEHDGKLAAARASLAPKGWAGWGRVGVGYTFVMLSLCCLSGFLFPGGPNYSEAQLRTLAFDLKVRPWPAAGKPTSNTVATELSLTGPQFEDGEYKGEHKVNVSDREVFTETILEEGDKLPRKLKRRYTVATSGDANSPRAYQGKTVLFDLNDGRYSVSLEGGGDLDPADADRLARSVTNFEADPLLAVLPKVDGDARWPKVKAGDSWPVEAELFTGLKTDEPLFDTVQKTEKAEATLVKFYVKNRKLWAVIEVTHKVATRGSADVEYTPPAVVTTTFTFDVVVDGTSAAGVYRFTGEGSGTTEVRGRSKVETKGTFSYQRERSGE